MVCPDRFGIMVPSASPDHPAPTILVVEDEVFIRMVSADMLTDAGYHVLEAENAAEALAVLESAETVELLFTDVRMPGSMNGLELAATVHVRWPKVHLLVTSGHHMLADDEVPDDGRFLAKPYRLSDVLAEVRRSLA